MTDSILTKDTKAKIKRLAYYQITGGFVGTLLSIYSIIKSESPASYIYFLATTLMVFNLFTIFSGQQLITGKVKRGLLLSLICQIPQIINFTIAGFGFTLVSGILISIGVDYTKSFKLVMNSDFSMLAFNWNNQDAPIIFNINIVAAFWTAQIVKIQENMKYRERLLEGLTL